jgi:RHS repeat-associated protein
MRSAVTSETPADVDFIFNATDQDNYDMLMIPHYTTSSYVWPVVGYKIVNGGTETQAAYSYNPSNAPTVTSTSTLWVQVQYDGTTLSVKELVGTSAPTSSAWSAAGAIYSATGYPNTGGLLGFKCHESYGSADIAISQVTVNSYDSSTSAFDITEHFDNFSVNSSTGVATNTLASDSNGNQTFDVSNVYTYDAWNRMVSVAHGYRDASNNLQHGHVFETITYDAKGRRVTKAINGTGQWDCTYNYYLDKDSVIEERNGSNLTIKQYLWGLTYIDELVQTSLNSSPSTQSTCDTPYWAMQDSNFNNLGVVNSSGVLTERYEYTPYGQRVVYFASGTNDVGDFAPSVASQRFVVSSTGQAWGINNIGHQGLMHDEEISLGFARNRYVEPTSGRWMERDPLGYLNGCNLYQMELSNSIYYRDPYGLEPLTVFPIK